MPLPQSPRSRFFHSPHRLIRAEQLEPRSLLAVGPASLVKDIQTATASSVPTNYVAVGGTTLFRADDGVHGNEWYRTDGTAAGTSLLLDINPGEAASNPVPTAPADVPMTALVGGTLFFSALHPTSGVELWKTDGTPQGTSLVKDIRPGTARSNPTYLTAVGDTLYFIADDGVRGVDLWKSDGTEAGTVRVQGDSPDGGSSRPVPLGALGGRLVFAADAFDVAAVQGRELWITDGTAAGTSLLKNILPAGGSNPGLVGIVSGITPGVEAVVSGGALYFAATDATNGRELWKTDGTPQGTVRVFDANPGAGSSNPTDLTVVGDSVYFTGRPNSFDNSLFRTLPAGGAVFIQALASSSGHTTGNVGGAFFITARLPGQNNAAGLYRHNPSAAGALTLVRPLPGTPPVKGRIFDAGGVALFMAPGPASDTGSVWRSDGTPAGTVALATFPWNSFDPVGSERWRLRAGANGVYYYAQWTPGQGIEPYRTNGTAPGTGQLIDLNRDTNAGVAGGVGYVNGPAGGRALFVGLGDVYFAEPWVSDGTAAGTTVLRDIWPGDEPGISSAGPMVRGSPTLFSPDINGRVYFIGRAQNTGLELWSTDGTPAGTGIVKDMVPGPDSGGTSFVMPFRGAAHFFHNSSVLYRTDGTAAGTIPVLNFEWPLFVRNVIVDGDTMYVFALRQGGGSELWKTDGTQAGTSLVKVISPDANVIGTETAPVAVLDGRVYFVTQTGSGRPTLWSSDGTSAGTSPVAQLPNYRGTLTQMVTANGRVIFEAGIEGAADPSQTTVWVADRTGARPLADVAPAVANLTKIEGLTSAGNVAYFFGRPSTSTGVELWRTDGTAAGTVRLKAPSFALALNVVDGVFYFNATDATNGRELWRSDGTVEGTFLLQDIHPGSFGSEPRDLSVAGDRIYFHADDGTHGHELWSMPRAAVPSTVAGRSVFYNDSAFDGRDPAATTADLSAIATDKVALLPGQASSFANVTSYDKGINGVLIDFAGAPPAALGADDFRFQAGRTGDPAAWAAAPAPASVVLISGPAGAVTRYAVTWPEGAIVNTWLRVTVKANERTRLTAPDVFSIGNLIGETGTPDGSGGGTLVVSARDMSVLRRRAAVRLPVDNASDINRDGVRNVLDTLAVRRNLFRTLPHIGAAATGGAPAAGIAARAAPPTRALYFDAESSTTGGEEEG